VLKRFLRNKIIDFLRKPCSLICSTKVLFLVEFISEEIISKENADEKNITFKKKFAKKSFYIIITRRGITR